MSAPQTSHEMAWRIKRVPFPGANGSLLYLIAEMREEARKEKGKVGGECGMGTAEGGSSETGERKP